MWKMFRLVVIFGALAVGLSGCVGNIGGEAERTGESESHRVAVLETADEDSSLRENTGEAVAKSTEALIDALDATTTGAAVAESAFAPIEATNATTTGANFSQGLPSQSETTTRRTAAVTETTTRRSVAVTENTTRRDLTTEASPTNGTVATTSQATTTVSAVGENNQGEIGMKNIEITVGSRRFSAELYDNPTAKAFGELLPLTLNMSELGGNEKYYYLDSSLPTNATRPGKISSGDLMLFGNNCVVLFYESFSTSYSYTPIGRVSDPAALKEALGTKGATVSFALK